MNLSLLLDLYELTMGESYLSHKKNTLATFDLFVRKLPPNRSYLIAVGLEDVLKFIKNINFCAQDLKFLEKQGLFSKKFLGYLKNFKFSGDIWAMREGEVFFANEPIIRVTAPLIEAQLIESFLLNTINIQTMIASKASRVASAAGNRGVYDFSLRRTHGADAAIKAARASFIAGCLGTSNMLAAKLYGIPTVGTMAHSFVMVFKNELDSFLAYCRSFPDKTILLVDTYDTKKGLQNAIKAASWLKSQGHKLQGIRLDSGDIVSLSRFSRKALDKAGLKFVKIFASGNLDEFKIKHLLDNGAAIDSFGVGTNMGVSTDAPSLDVIYKISEVTDKEGNFFPTMKLSKAKANFPGRKQVYRVFGRNGKYSKDILGLEKEGIQGKPLLIRVVKKGKLIYRPPSLGKIRNFAGNNLKHLPQAFKEISGHSKYPVLISPKLMRLKRNLSLELGRRQ